MSNYTQTTFFGPKDALPPGNPAKTIFGAPYDVEFGNIAIAIASKFDSTSGVAILAATTNSFLGSATIAGTFQVGSPGTPLIAVGTGGFVGTANQTALTNVVTVTAVGQGPQ